MAERIQNLLSLIGQDKNQDSASGKFCFAEKKIPSIIAPNIYIVVQWGSKYNGGLNTKNWNAKHVALWSSVFQPLENMTDPYHLNS